jgi:hypothetical protein
LLKLAAFGAAWFINFGRNRTLHCGLTGPIFMLATIVAATVEAGAHRLVRVVGRHVVRSCHRVHPRMADRWWRQARLAAHWRVPLL